MNIIDFEDSIYSFFVSKENPHEKKNALFLSIGSYYIIYDNNGTNVDIAKLKDRQLVILGDCVNVSNGQSIGISTDILLRTKNIEDIINYEFNLGGKYVIFYYDEFGFYCLGDATCSIPIYYSKMNEKFYCSSNIEWIRKYLNLKPDKMLLKIRKSCDISQAMPYDVTVYKEIKQLLPNHYLNMLNGISARFVNAYSKQNAIPPDVAVNETVPLIENILKMYLEKYKIDCPITSGRDSRVVITFLKELSKDCFRCYTIQHDGINANSQDIILPKKICEKLNEPYDLINDQALSEKLIHKVDGFIGKGAYSRRTLKIANTVKLYCMGNAIVNGDILGQVGKCSLHRDIPEKLANAEYFRYKLHNYSKSSKFEIQKWINEIKKSDEHVNLFDLFSIENRLGRWAAQENLIYNVIGQVYINFYNSRSIIYRWTAVERKFRKQAVINIGYISIFQKDLVKLPFEKDSLITSLAKYNGITYFVGSAIKYYVGKMLFLKNGDKKNE